MIAHQILGADIPRLFPLWSIVMLLPTLGLIYLAYRILVLTIFDQMRDIPGPFLAKLSSLPSSMASVQGKRAHRLLDLHNMYGPVVRIGPNEVSVGSSKYYRAIYGNSKTSSKDGSFYGAATFVGHDNIFQMVNKSQHAARRKLASSPYSLQSMASLNPLIKERAEVLVDRLASEAAVSPVGTVNALKLCGLFSFEVVCKAAFAKEFDEATYDDALDLLNAMDESAMTMIFDSAMPWLRKSGFATRLPGKIGDSYRSHHYWSSKSKDMVGHFLENSSESNKYLLTPFVKGKDEFLGRTMTNDELVEEAMGFMFAGSGTTSTTLTYLLYAISQPEHRHIQERLRREVKDAPDEIVSLRKLPYLNAVIKETFRLYPTIMSTLPRILNEPLTIESFVLAPGTIVGMQNYVHQRDPKVFLEPLRFLPERWLTSTEEMEGALTPFSVGRRNCIGQNLAWEELYLAVSRIVSKVELTLDESMQDTDMDMIDRFNIAPKGGKLNLNVTRLSL